MVPVRYEGSEGFEQKGGDDFHCYCQLSSNSTPIFGMTRETVKSGIREETTHNREYRTRNTENRSNISSNSIHRIRER